MPLRHAIPPEQEPEQAIPGDSNDEDTEAHGSPKPGEHIGPEEAIRLRAIPDEDDTEDHRGRA